MACSVRSIHQSPSMVRRTPLEKLQRRKAKGFTDGIDRGDGGIPFSFYDSTDIAILQIRKIREGRFGHLSFFSDFFDCNASGFQ